MEFRDRPQSRLVLSVCFRISTASNTLLLQYLGSWTSTLASSQFTLCCCSHAWTAIPFFVSPLFTAALCSTSLFFKFLPVSPMYELLQSKHGTLYTTPFFSSGGLGSFTFIRDPRRVPLDLNTALIPICLQIHCMCSDVCRT